MFSVVVDINWCVYCISLLCLAWLLTFIDVFAASVCCVWRGYLLAFIDVVVGIHLRVCCITLLCLAWLLALKCLLRRYVVLDVVVVDIC